MRARLGTSLLVLSSLIPLRSQGSPTARPKLTIVIVVDQMRADYLDRFGDLFGEGGFHLLMKGGARFTNSNYPYSSTLTGPGHSVILSGIPPSKSGIIGNDWYDRASGRTWYCAEDRAVHAVGADSTDPAGKMSPRNFKGETLADLLRNASPGSKVVGIALKDRGAILPAGKHPTGAYWFEYSTGRWITSSYYDSTLPNWVVEFDKHGAEKYLGKEWRKLLPEEAYVRQGPDSAAGEGILPGETSRVFPHRASDLADQPTGKGAPQFKRFESFVCTPYADDLTIEFAEAAIRGERLGRRGESDILSVSFSSPDYCGHTFGPDSHEIEDILLRLDRQLAGFFRFIDSTVGMKNVAIVLTADHGVAPLPEQTKAQGGLRLSAADMLLDMKVHMGQTYNYDEGNDNLIRSLIYGSVWLDTAGIAGHHFDAQKFERDLASFAERMPGVARCYLRDEILNSSFGVPGDSIIGKVRESYDPVRGADLMIVVKPYCIFGDKDPGIHGTPYWYDCHVPLIFYGPGFRAGSYGGRSSPLDIAPTLARVLSIAPPEGCEGRPLTECFVK